MLTTKNGKKDLNFELNLLPVFDMLASCICFLLMTAIWIHVGSMDFAQALGGAAAGKENPPSIWANMNSEGQIVFSVKDAERIPGGMKQITLTGGDGKIKWNTVSAYIDNVHRQAPEIKTALIMPNGASAYEDVVQLMDLFKKRGIKDIGISPL
jgi:biopolymer transport protein TolR